VAPTGFALFAFIETPLAAAALAGGAVSIPIIIHLLNRRRFRVVTWAAMRFLLAAQRKNSRRMRLEQLLLLALRCCIVLLLVGAMASVTPWAEAVWHWVNPEGGLSQAAGGPRTHKILVVDGSFSMGLKLAEGTCFEKARAMAGKIVRDSSGGDGFSVVLMAAPPRRVVPEPSEDGRRVANEIDAIRLTHGNADLVATLNTVESLVRASPGKYPQREVYFLTDMQQSTWIARQPQTLASTLQKIQSRARTIFVDVGRDNAENLAVTNLALGDSMAFTERETAIRATLQNFGPTRNDVTVRLLVARARTAAGDRPAELHEADVKPHVKVERNQPTTVTLTYRFPSPGDYVLQVQVQHDGLEVDDLRSAVLTVKNTVPVLLVNGKPAVELYDRATEWLRTALNPFDDGPTPVTVAARPKVINESQFADEGLGDLTPYDCVFVCDVPRFSPAEVRRLEAHVRRGGSVIFCMGDHVDIGSYNEMLYRDGKGLLPARLVSKQSASADYSYQFALDADADREDPLTPFRGAAARERLLACRFRQFIQVEPAPRSGPRKVLSFVPVAIPSRDAASRSTPPPGGPAILEWHPPVPPDAPNARTDDRAPEPPGRMRGRVVLITTTVNSDWNNWPISPSFPPLMQELLTFAASARLREQAIEVGAPLELYLPNTAAGVEAVVRTPDGRREPARTVTQDDASLLRWTDTDVSGVYTVALGQDPHEYLFAVNVPAVNETQQLSESDLTRTSRLELEKTYPEWQKLQVVSDPGDARHAPIESAGPELVLRPIGPTVARWLLLALLVLVLLEVVLAWQFGHFSAAAQVEQERPRHSRALRWPLAAVPVVLFTCGITLAAVLLHDVWTGDFLGFLPEGMRRGVEHVLGIPPPAPGEGSRWRLEFSSFLWDSRVDVWIAGTLAAAALAGVYLIYAREGRKLVPSRADRISRGVRVGLRIGLLLLLLSVLLPQLKLWFERQGWPDVVILFDDSNSMSTTDRYRDPEFQAVADRLAANAGMTKGERLQLARALVTRSEPDWLTTLLTQRKVRVHVYHCSGRAHRIADVTEPADLRGGLDAINTLLAETKNDSSQLGAAVRQVLNDFRGSSLAAVVMLTDGVTTEGEDLPRVSKYAQQLGVPLFFVGIGDAHEVRDVYLHDLQVAESVFINDKVVFEVNLTSQGYGPQQLKVFLREKGKRKDLDTQTVTFDGSKKTVHVRLTHKPTEPGERTYEIEVPPLEDEVDKDNNRVERQVFAQESHLIKVLYIEGYRRYEYHYLKTLLERESNRVKGNKTIDLKVLLMDADPDFAAQDRSAISEFPTRGELFAYDAVILGDVDPQGSSDAKMAEHLKDLADFVRERGGGLLMIAGERFSPQSYRETPLKDVLPIDLGPERSGEPRGAEPIESGYKPELTAVGRMHPIFRLEPDEKASAEVWDRLRDMFWYAEGFQVKRAAEVLAVHPKVRHGIGDSGPSEKHPLVVQHFIGAGRTVFFGFDETWRWGFREDQLYYNRFWIEAIRYLARSKVGRIELRLDRPTAYRRGEPIKLLVRFPDDAPPPPPETEVKVVVERRNPTRPGDTEVRTVQLAPLKGSRATFEALLTQTPEGEYKFWLSQPTVSGPKPRAEARVLTPPGEMERLRMNQPDLERAAEESHGKFYSLADAERLVAELPVGTRITVNAPGPPYLIWNHMALFLLALGFLTAEWIMRKQNNLL
jgi:uncharacterized membrane protein